MANSNSSLPRTLDQRSKSCETACSSNSSCFFQRRKPVNPLAHSIRSNSTKSTANCVRQRVLSAKLLKLKSVQNQLNDANYHLAEVMRENQALKTLQKRQDKALSRYEGTNAELPRLLQSHEEEIRILTEKNKALRKNVKELNEQLKHKNDESVNLQEQLKHYEKLDKDKHLLEREQLCDELQDIKAKLEKADNEIILLNRKLSLENKSSKQKLNIEVSKHKQCQRELNQSLTEINKLTKLLEGKDKLLNGRKNRFTNLVTKEYINSEENLLPVTEVKLQPLRPSEENGKIKTTLKCPSETIKARLSSDSVPSEESDEEPKEKVQPRPNSMKKLEKIELNLQNTLKKIEDNKSGDELSKHFGNYCLKALDSVKNCDEVIENHKENLANAKDDTDKLVQTIKETVHLEQRLKLSSEMNELDFVSQILKEESEFQEKHQEVKNNKKMESTLDKKQLLATLRAIDNEDDSFDAKNNIMSELFGDISN